MGKVLSELEKRYDLKETNIYLHGDGAGWIQTGLEWLPNSQHVLDKFHKNKALKKVCFSSNSLTQTSIFPLLVCLVPGNCYFRFGFLLMANSFR